MILKGMTNWKLDTLLHMSSLLWLRIHHNDLVNLFQTIVCYNKYFGHVQSNNHPKTDFIHKYVLYL